MQSIETFNRLFGILAHTHRSLKESKNSKESLNTLKKKWAINVLARLNVDLKIIGTPCDQKSILFVGNHIGYLDIPLLMSSVENISFVAKQELSNWPIFGSGAKRLDTVFVKRDNCNSRSSAKLSIQTVINEGKRVIIFPSGTTSIDNSKQWKKGAFEIAATTNCLVQPFRISYEPLREVAYIDDDFFPTHLYKLFGNKTIKATIEFNKPVKISNPIEDCLLWGNWSKSSDGQMYNN